MHQETPQSHDPYPSPAKPNHVHEEIENKINELKLLLTAMNDEVTAKINELNSDEASGENSPGLAIMEQISTDS